jgi:DNA transposition AAA+ family ATPase
MTDQTPEPAPALPQPLIDRERIRGAKRIIGEGTSAAEVTADQIIAVRNDVELCRRKFKISRKEIAQAIGYSHSVLTEFLSGTYRGNNAQVAIDAEAWLIEEESRRSRPQSTCFCWTNAALTIKATASYALDYKRIGLVYGPDSAGIGKTTAALAIHQTLGPRRSSLVTTDKVDCTATGLLKKLSAAVHVDGAGSNRARFTRIVNALKGRSHLLIVDQVHNLRGAKGDQPFYILTDIFDATEAGQLWIGTADLVSYLNRQRVKNADESLAQIRRRIFPCIDIMDAMRGSDGGGNLLVTLDQVREMFSRNQLRLAGDAARFLCKLINTPDSGGVGQAVALVEFATLLGNMSGATEIGLPLIREAMLRCLGSSRMELALKAIDDGPAVLAKVG